MKNRFILLFSLLLSLGFGQKKEYRSALKKFNGGDVDGAAQMLADNAQILSSADAKLAPSITFLEGKIAAAKEEFFVRFKNWLMVGGIITRIACGMIIIFIICERVSPIDLAASI